MRGRIKWFSPEKGFGFVTDESGADHYLSKLDFKDQGHPRSGDSVFFLPVKNNKGSRASQVRFAAPMASTTQPVGTEKLDHRVQCKSCHRLMVPRIITGPPLGADRRWTPVPKRSVCPFCASTHETFPPSAGEQMAELAQRIIFGIVLLIVGAMFLRSWH
jgi:cold shock CspA family protein